MALEIERKFLVTGDGWRRCLTAPSATMRQAYLSADPRATVRVRIADGRAWLTVKGRTNGVTRSEWEYPIPAAEAAEMIDQCGQCELAKTRHYSGRWEIDEYGGPLRGLIVAEIELTDPDEVIELPAWAGREVTGDPRYYNSSLAIAAEPPHD